MFGERFYPLLQRLSPWKQSLFALALAQRQLAHFCLWGALNGKDQAGGQFAACLKQLWYYHQDKFNHIDIESALQAFEPLVPNLEHEPNPDDPSTGTLLATDAAICLTAAGDAIIMHEGNEAEIASRASLSAAILAAQQRSESFLDEEALREQAEVDAEVNFQVSVLELLIKAKREPNLVQLILKSSLKDGCSNIGLSLETDAPWLHASYYQLPLAALQEAAKTGRAVSAARSHAVPKAKSKLPRAKKTARSQGQRRKGAAAGGGADPYAKAAGRQRQAPHGS